MTVSFVRELKIVGNVGGVYAQDELNILANADSPLLPISSVQNSGPYLQYITLYCSVRLLYFIGKNSSWLQANFNYLPFPDDSSVVTPEWRDCKRGAGFFEGHSVFWQSRCAERIGIPAAYKGRGPFHYDAGPTNKCSHHTQREVSKPSWSTWSIHSGYMSASEQLKLVSNNVRTRHISSYRQMLLAQVEDRLATDKMLVRKCTKISAI